MKVPDDYLNQIVMGDARDLAARLPDNSIDLIFTDPVYENIEDYHWLGEVAARVLKPGGSLLAFAWSGHLPAVMAAITGLKYEWLFSLYIPNRTRDTRCRAGLNKWTPCLWYSKGKAKSPRAADIVQCNAFQSVYGDGKSNHEWSKSPEFFSYYLRVFTSAAALVLDPFSGGGTVPSVCKMLGRNYIGFEVDPGTVVLSRNRLANTQPPLVVPQPAQDRLKLT